MRITSKGQVTIPAEIRERAGLLPQTEVEFEFDGKVWLYRLSREAKAWRDDQAQPAAFYYWEFQEQDGKRLLALRKAEGEPFAVTLYTGIPAGDVTVYRGGNR